VVRRHPRTGQRHLDLLTWGLLPYWTKEPAKARRTINARSETAATSGTFKDAQARRRCLVPADAFYEWKVIEGGKPPYAMAREDGQPMAFAGQWESFRWPDETLTRHVHHPDHDAERGDGRAARPHAGDPGAAGLAGLAGRS
jgi:putative SOS response-associated peptidase YedK